jgi:Skp family chaperone for outer membrane proteins
MVGRWFRASGSGLVVAAMVFASATWAIAQEPPTGESEAPAAESETPPAAGAALGQAGAFPIAVVRLDKILRENARLQSRVAPLKAEASELDKTIQVRQSEIESTQARLARVPPGSSDFEKLQLQLARLRTELQLFVTRERQKIQNREGQEYLLVLRDMEKVLASYCKERGIRLVLRHQEPPEGNEPNLQTVLAALNRGIVYADELDITDEIAKLLAEHEQSTAESKQQ